MAVQWVSQSYTPSIDPGVGVDKVSATFTFDPSPRLENPEEGITPDFGQTSVESKNCTSEVRTHNEVAVRDPDNAVQLISQTKITKAINIYTQLAKKVAEEIREEAWKKVQTDSQITGDNAPPDVIFDQFSGTPVSPSSHKRPKPIPVIEAESGIDSYGLPAFLNAGVPTLDQLEASEEEVEDVYEHDQELVEKAAKKKIIYENMEEIEHSKEALQHVNDGAQERQSIVRAVGGWNTDNSGRSKRRQNRRLLTKHPPQKEEKSNALPVISSESVEDKTSQSSEKSGGLMASLGKFWNSFSDGIASYTSYEQGSPSMVGLP
jgi:hypothetical protein